MGFCGLGITGHIIDAMYISSTFDTNHNRAKPGRYGRGGSKSRVFSNARPRRVTADCNLVILKFAIPLMDFLSLNTGININCTYIYADERYRVQVEGDSK